MSEYNIHIEWIQAWADGCWVWTVRKEGTFLGTGTSLTRWTGLWFAKRFARRHAKGKIKTPELSSTFTYTV